MKLPKEITNGNKYKPLMEMTDPIQAKEYLEACIEQMMLWGWSRKEATEIEINNIGYFVGYYNDNGTRQQRMKELLGIEHPIFDKMAIHY